MKTIVNVLVGLASILIIGAVTAVLFFDINSYREPLAEALSRSTGQTFNFSGPLHLRLTTQGIILSAENATLGNPAWAKSPYMAQIGKVDLGIKLLPLFQHQLQVASLQVDRAILELETSEQGENNWQFLVPNNNFKTEETAALNSSSAQSSVHIRVDHIVLTNSAFSFLGSDGSHHELKFAHLVLGREDDVVKLDIEAYINSVLVKGIATIGKAEDDRKRPIYMNIMVAATHVMAQGQMNVPDKYIDLDTYQVEAGSSILSGKASVNWALPRLLLKGSLTSSHLIWTDFMAPSHSLTDNVDNYLSITRHVMSDDPLDFNELRLLDAQIDVNINNLSLQDMKLDGLQGQLNLQNGLLSMPLKISFGQSMLASDVRMNVGMSPPQLGMQLTSFHANFSDLLGLWHAPAFLSGSVDINATLAASGKTVHEMASALTGSITIISSDGQVSSSAADSISSKLMEIFAPGGSSHLNCFAARFVADKGIIHDNGILISTPMATIAGHGLFNMHDESIDFVFHTQTDVINFGGLLPPLLIKGNLSKIEFSLDPKAVFQKVIGVFSDNGTINNVPDLIQQPGQNACLYTLQHPTGIASDEDMISGGLEGMANKIKNITTQLLKGVLGQ